MKWLAFTPCLHPLSILPLVIQRSHDRRRLRRHFMAEPEWIGLIGNITAVTRYDVIFISRPLPKFGNESAPESGKAYVFERMRLGVPIVEIANHRDSLRIR